jgi:glycosyltransferase involved in cell wall biosynthesis
MSHPRRHPALLSVVVPCYNEEAVLAESHRALLQHTQGLGLEVEVVYVDDGSTDRTADLLRRLAAEDPRVRFLRLSRNFGHQIAATAGLDHARGDVVVLIDADLQDPPEVIPRMVEKWRQGYQVVYGRRRRRDGETAFKRSTAALFYRLINRISEVEIPVDTGDFRLMDRAVVLALRRLPERDRFLRGLVSWVGYRQTEVPYDRAPRVAGTSKYPLRKMLRFSFDAIFSFSLVPLKVATFLGLAASVLAVVGIVYALILRLFTDIWVSGWTLLFIAVLFMSGIQLTVLGVAGEYLGRIYLEVKRRPLYLLAEEVGPAGEPAEPEAGP